MQGGDAIIRYSSGILLLVSVSISKNVELWGTGFVGKGGLDFVDRSQFVDCPLIDVSNFFFVKNGKALLCIQQMQTKYHSTLRNLKTLSLNDMFDLFP